MSVICRPSDFLGFRRPLTREVKQILTMSNPHHDRTIVYRIMVSLPHLYCVQPPYGRIAPRESVNVDIVRQKMAEEPPLAYEYRDKFLILTRDLEEEQEGASVKDLWKLNDQGETHEHKIRVVFLPAAGQTWDDEEDELDEDGLRFETSEPLMTPNETPAGSPRLISPAVSSYPSCSRRTNSCPYDLTHVAAGVDVPGLCEANWL
ncbi:PapD-like protein [Pterulicium gracile]|uniref:PapD-like protein n=1 Tax=Pterulicium gracile TaxID=1884261 RepID=A0A5C3QGQ3_9AGAR|nr:PapD-like protein [Pterula gracilis]